MGKNRSKPLRLVHDNPGANIATWSKAFVLFPPWALILLAPYGAVCRQIGLEGLGLWVAICFGVMWFIRDLLLKRILITDTMISCGLSRIKFADLKAIRLEKNRFGLPIKLVFAAEHQSRPMILSVTRLTDDALEILLDTLQRRAPEARIDSAIDDVLQYRRRKVPQEMRDLGSTVSITYHSNRSWEGLLSEFGRAAGHWSRNLGPVGVFLLCFPIWISVDLASFYVMRDYSRYDQNQQLYNSLIAMVGVVSAGQFRVLDWLSKALLSLADHPVLFLCGLIMAGMAINGISKSIFGANRITIDKDEVSLDRWMSLASVNLGSVVWSRVGRIGLDKTLVKPAICFFGKEDKLLLIELDAIDGADRSRLLKSIRRFAPECPIDADVLELLEPGNKKSYTQLWLQSLTSAPQRKNLEPLKSGDLVHGGRYEVVKRLGVGGQGSAYLCLDLTNVESGQAPNVVLKEVVIPVFVEQVVREKTIDKFVQEAELLERVNTDCPDVVKLLDYFVDDHRAYLVLEHVDGTPLRELVLKGGPMPPPDVEKLAVKMCTMLKTLHDNEVIHRDFTPDNLILRKDGQLTLIDFNVAQSSDAGITDTIVGKHAYIPPEQFRGRPSKQSDLYALGATVCFLLTGIDPEPLSQSSVSSMLDASNPDPIVEVLDKLIQSCTAMELPDRCGSCADALCILNEVDAHDTTESNSNDTMEANAHDTMESNANDTMESNANDTMESNGKKLKVRSNERVIS